MIAIYKITSPTGKIYIGQSTNIEKRKSQYAGGHCRKQVKLHASILKHGWDNHTFEIIEECERKSLNEREVFWINYYNVFNTEHGLNLDCGGGVGPRSEATKAKISASKMGKLRPDLSERNRNFTHIRTEEQNRAHSETMMGKSHSDETKKKMSVSAGKWIRTDEHKKKMSDAAKNKELTPEHKKKIIDWMKTGIAPSKKVINVDTGEIYQSCKVLAEKIGMGYGKLKSRLNGGTVNKTPYRYL